MAGEARKARRIGYVRVSSEDQNPARQLEGQNIEPDCLFVDRASGKDRKREGLTRLLQHIASAPDGQRFEVVVHSMDRLARNARDLLNLTHQITEAGHTVYVAKDRMTLSADKQDLRANLMLTMLAAIAEFERELSRERQREGITLAKKRGVYKGRRRVLTPMAVLEIERRIAAGEPKAKIAREAKIGRVTLYRYLRAAAEGHAEAAAAREAQEQKQAAVQAQHEAAMEAARAAARAELAEVDPEEVANLVFGPRPPGHN